MSKNNFILDDSSKNSKSLLNTWDGDILHEIKYNQPGAKIDLTKSPLERIFGKMNPGSVRGSIFSLIILTLGPGCLAIPLAVGNMSLIIGLISLLTSALVTYWTLFTLGKTSQKYRIFQYSHLVRHLMGNKVAKLLDMFILIGQFGVLILYQVIVYKMLGEIIYNLGGYYKEYKTTEEFLIKSFWSHLYLKFSVMYGITITILLPLCLFRDVSRFGYSSLIGIITFIYLIIVLIAQSPKYINYYWNKIYKEDDPSTHLNILNFYGGFDINLFFFQGTATFFFFYACHPASFPIFSSLKDNNSRRIHKVIKRGLLTNTFFFILIAIFGYLTCPIMTPPLIIERNNIQGGLDIIMSLCKLSLVIILIMKIPIIFNAFKISFFQLFFGNSELTNKRNWLISVITLSITVIIAILYDKITEYLQLIGGFICTITGYVIPGLIYIKESECPRYHWKVIGTVIFIFVSVIIGFTSGIFTIKGIIDGKA